MRFAPSRLPRVLALLVAAVAVAVLLVWALGAGSRAPDPARRADASPPDLPARPLVEAESPRLEGRTPQGHAGEEGHAEAKRPVPPPSGAPPGVAGWIEVTVEAPYDWPEVRGTCYALPAGALGADEVDQIAHAEVRASASTSPTVRVPVPRAGRWDVGFVGSCGHALTEDVLVEDGSTATARITFPGYAPLRVRVPAGLPAPPDGHVLLALVSAHHDEQARGAPGRGEHAGCGTIIWLERTGSVVTTPSLASGVEWRIRVTTGRKANAPPPPLSALPPPPPPPSPAPRSLRPPIRYTTVPDVARAGDTVDVIAIRPAAIELRLTYEGTFSRAWRGNGCWLHFYVEVDEGWASGAGVMIGPAKDQPYPDRAVVYADPGSVRISWRAGGVLAGRLAPFTVSPGEVVRRDVIVRLDPDYDPSAVTEQDLESDIRLRVTGSPDGERGGELVLFGRGRDVNGRVEIRDARWSGVHDEMHLDATWQEVPHVLAVLGKTHASRPVPGPRGQELDVRLEPAGLVQVAPTAVLPASLGRVRIRRKDGHPIAYGRYEDWDGEFGGIGEEASGRPGTILGPFPSGEYVFSVFVGAVHSTDVRVTVEPGRMAVLRYGP